MFKLAQAEADSAVWKKIRAQLEQRLCTLRHMNDNDLDAESTAKVRGGIAEVKRMLGYDPANKGSDRKAATKE